MAQKKCNLNLYRDFLIANQNRYSGLELSRVEPTGGMSHDAVTRWLMKADFRPQNLWQFAKSLVKTETGYLVLDDTVVSKPFARNIDLARPPVLWPGTPGGEWHRHCESTLDR